MELKTPQSLKAEHNELHAQLAKATSASGATSPSLLEGLWWIA